MDFNSTKRYLSLVDTLVGRYNIPVNISAPLKDYILSIYRSELEDRYSDPMLWIGMYIALASLCCILAMAADLLHGLRTRKLWFPCKYFSINAASLSVIAVAMKLPVDLSGSMPGDVDQVAKLGSMAFMCTMMANLLPCLATMDNNELLTNVTALGIFVVTLVVNMCIQINTGVVSYKEAAQFLHDINTNGFDLKSLGVHKERNTIIATTYVTLLMVLLLLHVCSSLAILKSKQIIESKYQQGHETASKEVQESTKSLLTVEKLEQHVGNYWIMAGSGSPQFIITCFATTTASGVICVFTTILHTLTVSWTISAMLGSDYDSGYKWSNLVILVVQFVGVVLSTIAPLSRCFTTLSFKISTKIILNHIKVFKVERYWVEKFYEWKHIGSTRFPFRKRKPSQIIKTLKNISLKLCIELQEAVVVVCKTIALLPFFFMICALYCLRCLKRLLHVMVSSPKENTKNLVQRKYVLQLEDEMELAKRTLKGLSESMNRLIQKSEKKQPKFLMELISEKSTRGLQGVKTFDNGRYVPFLQPKVEYQDCWSLPVVTLTTIAVTLPHKKEEVDSLWESVRQGLEYVTLVEKHLNATTDDNVSIHKAAETLWQEVYVCREWLGEKLQDIASQANTSDSQVDTTRKIVQWFFDKAKSKTNNICAYSMCCITRTILDDMESEEELFVKLSSRIADIMAACLTNLPQVIALKCHTNSIEKREVCVLAAARLLGETKEVINTLQHRPDMPSLNPIDLPFIDKWRAYLSDP